MELKEFDKLPIGAVIGFACGSLYQIEVKTGFRRTIMVNDVYPSLADLTGDRYTITEGNMTYYRKDVDKSVKKLYEIAR